VYAESLMNRLRNLWQWLVRWLVRLAKILWIGVATCGLGWFWIAFYLFVVWRQRQRRRVGGR